jgi:hypothetical protein
MSTQKRENRDTQATHISCSEPGCRRQRIRPDRAGGWYQPDSSQIARKVWERAGGRTAPLWSILWSALAWMATQFLQKDQPLRHYVQPDLAAELAGSPPPLRAFASRACGRLLRVHLARQLAAPGLPASPGHPAIPLPSGFVPSLLTLPYAPADDCRAERHDGKRDLYILNAA